MTTERVLPAIALPAPGRVGHPAPGGSPETTGANPARGAERVARPAVARRSEPFLTMPARAGILLGTSAAVYAISLAAIAGLQASDDAAVAARRQPALDAIAASRAANDVLQASITQADARTRALADRYGVLASDVTSYEASLDALAALVTKVEGSAAALPSRIRLPTVSVRGPIAAAPSHRSSAPRTTTSTRASGG